MPLVVLCFWIGIYPKPVLEFLHGPSLRLAQAVQPGQFSTVGTVNAAPPVSHGEPAAAPAPASEAPAPTAHPE